ncbi:MAG: hypothetical protein NTV84_03385 [Methanoregula sp.]|nr:hypothetical protein [Methanoregula sp.]
MAATLPRIVPAFITRGKALLRENFATISTFSGGGPSTIHHFAPSNFLLEMQPVPPRQQPGNSRTMAAGYDSRK